MDFRKGYGGGAGAKEGRGGYGRSEGEKGGRGGYGRSEGEKEAGEKVTKGAKIDVREWTASREAYLEWKLAHVREFYCKLCVRRVLNGNIKNRFSKNYSQTRQNGSMNGRFYFIFR